MLLSKQTSLYYITVPPTEKLLIIIIIILLLLISYNYTYYIYSTIFSSILVMIIFKNLTLYSHNMFISVEHSVVTCMNVSVDQSFSGSGSVSKQLVG